MGGEPLCDNNIFLTTMVMREMKAKLPNLKIWVWTGYEAEDIFDTFDPKMQYILNTANGLVTGPYVQKLRDITLPMRGSLNQQIIDLTE